MPGYHIEDQKPGVKKCGHQGGKVLVSEDEQIKRLSAARFQLDIMGVPGIIVARTDAESATLLDGRSDERDQPFILGATNLALPTFKAALPRDPARVPARAGIEELSGPRALRARARRSTPPPTRGSSGAGFASAIDDAAADYKKGAIAASTPRSTRSSTSSSTSGRTRPAS